MNSVQIYQELAAAHDQQGQAQVRDRFLVLAADAALSSGRADEAEGLRARLLQLNPHHLLKPFASLTQALESPDVKTYVEGLRRTYPPEEAELSLRKLKKEPAPARAAATPARPAAIAVPTVLPRTGPTSPEWEEVRRQPVTPEPPPRPAPAVAPPPPAPPPPPVVPIEEPIPFAPEPVVRKARTVPKIPAPVEPSADPFDDEAEEPAGAGSWFAAALFYAVLLASLALGIFTLARPFL
jgi:hypothetical protein